VSTAPSGGVRVYIALADAVYAEMLRIELLSVGIMAFIWRGQRPCPAQSCDIVICDAEIAHEQTGSAVAISQSRVSPSGFDADGCSVAAGLPSFRRPFLTARFRRELSALVSRAVQPDADDAPALSGGLTVPAAAPENAAAPRVDSSEEKMSAGFPSSSPARLTRDSAGVFYFGSDKLNLTSCEGLLLAELYIRRGDAVSRDILRRAVWGIAGQTNLVDVYIRYLREKLDLRYDVRMIITVRGVGYMLRNI